MQTVTNLLQAPISGQCIIIFLLRAHASDLCPQYMVPGVQDVEQKQQRRTAEASEMQAQLASADQELAAARQHKLAAQVLVIFLQELG